MGQIFRLISLLGQRKWLVLTAVSFQLLTALFTLISIPLVIPFFQILFGMSPTTFEPAESWTDLEGTLNYIFSRLIAISDRPTALMVVCWGVVVIFALRNICRYLANYFMVPPIHGVIKDVRASIFESFMNMSVAERYAYKKGQLLSVMSNDVSEIDHGILKASELLFKAPLIMIGSLVFMFWISAQLAVIALVLVLFIFIVIGGVNNTLKRQSAQALESLDHLQTATEEYLDTKKDMDAYGASEFFKDRFDLANERHFRQVNKIVRRRDLASPMTEFLGIVVVVVLLWYGANMVFDIRLQPPTFFAFIFAFYQIIDPAKTFSRELSNVHKASAAIDRIQALSGRVSDHPTIIEKGLPLIGFNESLELKDITFSYDDSEASVLQDLDLSISKGEHIGIVGLSGAGKTSLMDLVLRFFHPSKGKILLDGHLITQYNLDDYRNLFGLVSQDTKLFHGTFKENIVLGRAWNEAQFEDAITIAECLDFMSGKESGVNTMIGDQGVRLSAGQRQRLTIARAIYGKPDILIMDEPTSSLDLKSKYLVRQAVLKAMQNRTAIMISHNPEILKDLDRIVVLDSGTIIQTGSFLDLSTTKGFFKDLIAFQKRKIGD